MESTRGIIVGRGPVGDALARVMALAATCEADFQKLRTLFAVPGGFVLQTPPI